MKSLSIKDYHDHLFKVITSQRFLQKQGLGNEVPFFICPFLPSNANEIKKLVPQLMGKMAASGVTSLQIDLYDLSIELLQERGVWTQIIETEPELKKAELKELLQGILDTEKHLIPAISKKMAEDHFHVLFLTGIGEVFPYIRSHNVLNNLQSVAKDQPTIMFFPGDYRHSAEEGAALQLFNRLRDDKYYRAFNILHYEI